MGVVLQTIGLLWAALGVWNFGYMAVATSASDTMIGWGVVFNGVLFLMPGLLLAGFGSKLRQGSEAKQ